MIMRCFGIFCMLVVLSACGQSEQIEDNGSEQQEAIGVDTENVNSDELMAMIRQHLKPVHATSLEQCKVVGIGAKPCGGPERYLVYSSETADEQALLALIERYNQLRSVENEREGIVSDCQVTPRPSLELRNGMCRAVGRVTH